jgi:hypothetical protein
MLPGMCGIAGKGVGFSISGKDLIDLLIDMGLTNNLELCLDAADSSSYSGSGQTWNDVSGNGHNFFRGSTSSSQSSDPTFNGSAGGRSSSEYWSFDGGDFFKYSTTNEDWMNRLHKNNATFTLICWIYLKDSTVNQHLFIDFDNVDTDVGMQVSIAFEQNQIGFFVANSGTVYTNGSSSEGLFLTEDAWNFVGISVDEAGGSLLWHVNGSGGSESVTYTNPSTSNASDTVTISGDESIFLTSGTRIAQYAIWEGVALTAGNMVEIFQATRGRFGI